MYLIPRWLHSNFLKKINNMSEENSIVICWQSVIDSSVYFSRVLLREDTYSTFFNRMVVVTIKFAGRILGSVRIAWLPVKELLKSSGLK